MAVVISAADSSFSLVIQVLHLVKANTIWLLGCGLSFQRLSSDRVDKMALLVRINWRLGRRLIYSDEPRLLGQASVSMTQHSREHRFAITLPLALPTTVVTLSWSTKRAALLLTFLWMKGCRPDRPPSIVSGSARNLVDRAHVFEFEWTAR